jgi:hypothetical protein
VGDSVVGIRKAGTAARVGTGEERNPILGGTHRHLHVGPVLHVSESSPSAVLQRRLIRRGARKGKFSTPRARKIRFTRQ